MRFGLNIFDRGIAKLVMLLGGAPEMPVLHLVPRGSVFTALVGSPESIFLASALSDSAQPA